MNNDLGRKTWIFPDGDRPREGDFPQKGHESLIILNMTKQDAEIHITLYFTNREPIRLRPVTVAAQRVRCLRTNNLDDMGGVIVDYARQYAVRLDSNVEIVAQYGKLETSDQPMAYYTVMGYCN